LSASLADIEANNRASWKLALSIPLKVDIGVGKNWAEAH